MTPTPAQQLDQLDTDALIERMAQDAAALADELAALLAGDDTWLHEALEAIAADTAALYASLAAGAGDEGI